ncbi:MAG: hypothetical protein IT368_08870 [Candidatus Hydrogenedentes bacterium]|nr:hypothetical protein [Candidatus Hydrogenedentota bacterium]
MSLRWICSVLVCATCASALAEDYSFLWWADGWRGRAATWEKVIHMQTNAWGAAIDVEKPGILHLGAIPSGTDYAGAASASNGLIQALPGAELRVEVRAGEQTYSCTAAAGKQADEANFPVRIIESGRWVQRADILNLQFASEGGDTLEAAGRLEMVATPQRLRLLLEVTPESALEDVVLTLAMDQGATGASGTRHFDTLAAGEPGLMGLAWPPQDAPDTGDGVMVSAQDGDGAALPVQADALRGWYAVDLPERQWNVAEEPDRLDRYPVEVRNTSDEPKTCLVLFAFEDGAFSGITGLCPMLRDREGNPTGIPVQISKNWHRLQDRHFLYEGPWLHAFAEIPVAPGATWEGERAITYARWGGVPAASHAQLCLVGWGVNQLWDQAAIGSWGESITYDPDINLNRSMIDDIRPLMVTGMNGGQWEWTANVGGGDFLVYFDGAGRRQFLTRMRTAYLSQGPNLTDVVYAGVTADGKIAAKIEVSTPRCDDVNRAYHRVRYDVLEDMEFSRLAFYQLGADNYNDHTFSTIARGNGEGLMEEWQTERGGKQYSRTGMECAGAAPWFSLHGGERNVHHPKGAWANRGLVIRAWKARIGGEDCPVPFAAVFGTENGVASANVELAPPPGCTQLKKGDFVEAEVELLIVPMDAADYYGPNEALRADLEANGNTWRPIHRLARGNDLDVRVEQGTLQRRYPPVVAVDKTGTAAFEIRGGVGYVPLTISGLRDYKACTLEHNDAPVDQHVHGKDFWQTTSDGATATWSHTYNLNLDSGSEAGTHRIVVRP